MRYLLIVVAAIVFSTTVAFAEREAAKVGESCSDNECEEGLFCKFPVDACEAPGVCEPKPDICIKIYKPVCGCDERTYGNSCEAASHGVSLKSEESCDGKVKGLDRL